MRRKRFIYLVVCAALGLSFDVTSLIQNAWPMAPVAATNVSQPAAPEAGPCQGFGD